MRKDFLRLSLALIILIFIFYIFQQKEIAKESITYFPIDPSVTFPKASTSLEYNKKRFDEYSIFWKTQSSINKQAYLRQDMSFLFANGKLISTMGEWKQNKMELAEEKSIIESKSSLFQAVSFHFAEVHDSNGSIFSSQRISGDTLFVVNSTYDDKPFVFHTPKSNVEEEWKQELISETDDYIEFAYKSVLNKFGISLEDYHTRILLSDLTQFNDSPINLFSQEQTAEIIGQLTEGLYKNYFLGITKIDGSTISPIGSSMPVILIANNHLLVLFITESKEPVVLRQQISNL